mmetsp:Transcript_44144/g.58580  ORF Transcript_44144/g.58580 Transcript_44144/m.58580 type:complete len:85 (-) Transcript_44144:1892-2146(-)
MAQTFTGKMFSMRNNSLKTNQNTTANHLVGEKSGSVQLGHAKNPNSFNLGNYNNQQNHHHQTGQQTQQNQNSANNRQLQNNSGQ